MAKKRSPVAPARQQPHESPSRQSWPEEWNPESVLHLGDAQYEGVSETFRQFADPALRKTKNYTEMCTVLGIAMIAWNLATMPAHQRPRFLVEMLQAFPADIQQETRSYIASMVERKNQLFSEYRWMILKYHLNDGDYELTVSAGDLRETSPVSSVSST